MKHRTPNPRVLAFLFVALLAMLPTLVGQNSPSRRLVDRADAVVIGEVLSGHHAGRTATCTLIVRRTVKGRLLPNDRMNLSWTSGFSYDDDLTGRYGLWFLNESAAGSWSLLHVKRDSPYLPLSKSGSERIAIPTGVPVLPPAETAEDRMGAELVLALQAYRTPQDIRAAASELVALENTPFVGSLFKVLRANVDPELKAIGLAGMLKRNDVTALIEIAGNIDQLSKVQARPLVLSAIMSRRDVSPEAIQALGKISSSSDFDVQFSAGDALAELHTRDTVPFLAQLLDSPHKMTREAAMRGLSLFVENLPIATPDNVWNGKANIPRPGPAPYRTAETDRYSLSHRRLGSTDDTEYVQFWKSWWAKMRSGFQVR